MASTPASWRGRCGALSLRSMPHAALHRSPLDRPLARSRSGRPRPLTFQGLPLGQSLRVPPSPVVPCGKCGGDAKEAVFDAPCREETSPWHGAPSLRFYAGLPGLACGTCPACIDPAAQKAFDDLVAAALPAWPAPSPTSSQRGWALMVDLTELVSIALQSGLPAALEDLAARLAPGTPS